MRVELIDTHGKLLTSWIFRRHFRRIISRAYREDVTSAEGHAHTLSVCFSRKAERDSSESKHNCLHRLYTLPTASLHRFPIVIGISRTLRYVTCSVYLTSYRVCLKEARVTATPQRELSLRIWIRQFNTGASFYLTSVLLTLLIVDTAHWHIRENPDIFHSVSTSKCTSGVQLEQRYRKRIREIRRSGLVSFVQLALIRSRLRFQSRSDC